MMLGAEQLMIAAVSLMFFPIVAILCLTIVLASFGKSLGIRRTYVALLLRIFEFAGTKLAAHTTYEDESDSEDEDQEENPAESENGNGNGGHVIKRDFYLTVTRGLMRPEWEPFKKNFELSDICYFTKCGMEAIIEDDVTHRFNAGELASWNLLTRTNTGYQLTSARLTVLWCIGFLVRYCVLFPFRLILAAVAIIWLVVSTAFLGYFPPSPLKRSMYSRVSLMSFRIMARACSAVITFHNQENRVKNGICVANHTSPIDVFMLSCDNCYALVGQAHGGLLGLLQRALGRATSHVFFERSEVKDRHLVAQRLKEHVNDLDKLPILIFPEGTCINNTSVMMFKKGSFEVSTTIYPVAIKYDMRFGDAFWDSSKHGMVTHLFNIMTSWALVCDIWYLPPMQRQENEDAVQFANRVKREIAKQGGLVDLDWDGQLKRTQAKESWKQKPQEQYSNMLKVD
ncbi:glycerol-3-phosphate acyltransferase 3-like isoform X2 [Littorina saxatilis]|uniref:Phospholipid/glycerol acyltransferase domain-containing protein n=1 Tax=Littorina saxatilis TaxID=31220 RepID=A0AAN9BQT7_9CAEN